MRGIVARGIRKQASDITVGKPYQSYGHKRQRKGHTIVLKPDCTKAIVNKLKKLYELGLYKN